MLGKGSGLKKSARSGLVDNLGEFARFDGFEAFVAALEFLEGFDGGLGHAAVGLFGAAYEDELVAFGDAFVSVLVVQAHAEQAGFGGRGFAGRG
jgi:hypothetical protein